MNPFVNNRCTRPIVLGLALLSLFALGAAFGCPKPIAHGPSFPPDPWDGVVAVPQLIAHGPTFPPDPWDGVVAAPQLPA